MLRLQTRLLEFITLLAILTLAAFLRFAHLPENPGWYTDEATHISIAHHLAAGRIQYFAVQDSVLLFARPPLFHLLLAGLFRVFGESMAVLRGLTAGLGVLTVALLYRAIRHTTQRRILALLAAALLAIYPQAVLYSRFGFSYNLLAPFMVLLLWGLVMYRQTGRRWGLALASLAAGLGVIGDVAFLTVIPVVLLVALIKRWRDALWSMALAGLPFALFALWMLAAAPDAFLYDLRFTFSRLGTMPPGEQLWNIVLQYTTLISQDFWMLAGVIGLFLLRPPQLRTMSALLFFVPLVSMARSAALHNLSFYYMIPLLPLAALGVAGLLVEGVPHLYRTITAQVGAVMKPRWPAWVTAGSAILFLIISPFVVTLALTLDNVRGHYQTAIDPFLVNPADARAAAAYVNAQTTPDDLVIASPPVGWLLNGQVADFQMVIAAGGQNTPHLPGDLPMERWAFSLDYHRARFVIVDNLWDNWGVWNIPGLKAMMADVEQWPQVFVSGMVRVYAHPE
ncbi:MAG: glycosyltransferase family 39 protein [Anaerolineaceae bacterium]|nr:glycosyltransferase family 39 protein [Anaerolineaceae bacterium]